MSQTRCPSCGHEGHFHRDRVDGLLARGLINPDTLNQDSGVPCDCAECVTSDAVSARRTAAYPEANAHSEGQR